MYDYYHEYVPTNQSPVGFVVHSTITMVMVQSGSAVQLLWGVWQVGDVCMQGCVTFDPCTSINGENILPGLNVVVSLNLHMPEGILQNIIIVI